MVYNIITIKYETEFKTEYQVIQIRKFLWFTYKVCMGIFEDKEHAKLHVKCAIINDRYGNEKQQ